MMTEEKVNKTIEILKNLRSESSLMIYKINNLM